MKLVKNKKVAILAVLLSLVFIAGVFAGYLYFSKTNLKTLTASKQKDVYLAFVSEVFDKIKENYWDSFADAELVELFRASSEQISGLPVVLKENSRGELTNKITEILKNYDQPKKKEFVTRLADTVLSNLKPFGRSRLYSKKEEKDLVNRVNNIDPQKDLYSIIGVEKKASASAEELSKAYQQKTSQLEKEKVTNPEASEELKKVAYAYEVLSKDDTKKNYDQDKVEPTVFAKLLTSDIAYLRIKQLSPLTLEEFQKAADGLSGNPSSLIFDLRSNVGGAVDILPYFLGPFIGKNQYAYDFFHQGQSVPFKTLTGWLPSLIKYKKVVILVDGQTQSSAEVMAATLKKYNVGVVLGSKTKGWGTIEKVFPLETQLDQTEKYSLFLVHSLTLRDDNQPIEGNGVEPTVDITKPDWEKELFTRFESSELVLAVKTLIAQ